MDLLLIDLTIVDVAEKILGDSDDIASSTNQKLQNKYRSFCAPPKQGPGSGGVGVQSQRQAQTTPSGVYSQAADIG